MSKTSTQKKKSKPTSQQLEQRAQKKEIRTILQNIGFNRIPTDGKEFQYKDRISELDDIFVMENLVLLIEYTIGKPGDHLKGKKIFYDKVNESRLDFVRFMLTNEKFISFREYYNKNIVDNYSENQIEVRILYCSKQDVKDEHKKLVNGVTFFDYYIVHYFKYLSKAIKRSTKYEFFDFIGLDPKNFGDEIRRDGDTSSKTFCSQVLPEEKSYFNKGYKIVTFYISPQELLRRSYVLRREGWQGKNSVDFYQRMVDTGKIKKMRQYLSAEKRVFINNIITTISEDKIRLYDDKNNVISRQRDGNFKEATPNDTRISIGKIEIEDSSKIIGIIDGQHRIYAYHEGDDIYENSMKPLRRRQNLLVTGILFPADESQESRLKFEAQLFQEINNNQTKINSYLQQEIDLIVSPFSSTAIGKRIIYGLNQNGPLENLLEQYSYQTDKIKTASIISFGLKPLIKISQVEKKDSIFRLWDNEEKNKLTKPDIDNIKLRDDYVAFCVQKINGIFRAFKESMDSEQWSPYNPKTHKGLLSITFVNGILNTIRCMIENTSSVMSYEECKAKLKGINTFGFRDYKTSHYNRMGHDIYNKFLK
ncbi:MAG: DGQHR domain-containing protein [Bacteroidales bacterium]|nr:DGQHR domain-containing protein [Bacteroidales bacterium]